MSPFFPLFIGFLIVLTYFLRKNSRIEQETQERFWENERAANNTRRKDLSGLPYLTIPLDTFPLGKFSDSELSRIESELTALSDKPILNLNGITNTELKMNYGVANLEFLSKCDENYTNMVRLLQEYAKCLSDLSRSQEAIAVLRFAIDSGSDICATYTLLADIYLTNGQSDKISSLIDTASQLESVRKDAILENLNSREML